MKTKLAGIKRKEIYSPNHITNDTFILLRTGKVLEELGYTVRFYDEDYVEENGVIDENLIFSMAQGPTGLYKLLELEKKGVFIVNKPSASLNCHRINMIKLIQGAGIPFPQSIFIDTAHDGIDYFAKLNTDKIWLKRGDVHAEHREDVSLITNKEEFKCTLEDFHKRGIKEAVVQEHLPGPVIKFYGVQETDFFHWTFTSGEPDAGFNLEGLKNNAFSAAASLDLDIFGGDAIICENQTISIIDINDWPSFAPVREDAAIAIGNFIHNKVTKYAD